MSEPEGFHPLEHEWVLWEHKSMGATNDSAKWKENMKELCCFKTAEDFWRYFNHIPKVSEVFFDGDCRKKVGTGEGGGKTIEEYSLFKRGIEPEWGDPKNVTGGEWFCRQFFEGDLLDLYWQNLVMGLIGETIEDFACQSGDIDPRNDDNNLKCNYYINGARVVDKSRTYPMYKLEIWINTRDQKVKERIRQRLVEIMTAGQPPSRKGHPKFDWKDHSA